LIQTSLLNEPTPSRSLSYSGASIKLGPLNRIADRTPNFGMVAARSIAARADIGALAEHRRVAMLPASAHVKCAGTMSAAI
jgi:hypothetical protein